MISLDFKTIAARMRAVRFPVTDLVVGIGTGGIPPAVMAAFHLQTDLGILTLNYRDADNRPLYDQPVVLGFPAGLPAESKRILLVDDVSVTGKTLETARALLAGHTVTTLTLKGKADIVLFPEIPECVNWPWKKSRTGPEGR